MLDWVREGDDDALSGIEHDDSLVRAVVAEAAREPTSSLLAAQPRPELERGAHPARLVLHVLTRQYRYDGSAMDMAADCVEALDACLACGSRAWADVAASSWLAYLHHQSEPSTGWPTARRILERHRDAERPPRMLAAFAALAGRAGEAEVAAQLWQEARGHDALIHSARTRWEVEFEWARNHLLLEAAAPARAVTALQRAHAGLSRHRDEPGRFAYVCAALELDFALVWTGRCEAAVAMIEQTRRSLPPGGEFEPWLRGAQALPLALLGRPGDAARALHDSAVASTDTSSLELVATLPAAALVGALRGDRAAVVRAIDRARLLETRRTIDAELRLIWRTLCLLALVRCGCDDGAAADLVADTRTLAATVERRMPAHVAHARLVCDLALGDREGAARSGAALAQMGVEIPAGPGDAWSFLRPPHSPGSPEEAGSVLRVEVLDGLRVLLDGEEVGERVWRSRRKARTALAVLVAAGGRIDREALVEGLWPHEQLAPDQASRRLWPVLSVLRGVLAAEAHRRSGAPPRRRVLALGPGVVELLLSPSDSSDVHDLRRIDATVAACDPRDQQGIERAAQELLPLVSGAPLRDAGCEPLAEHWRERLRGEMLDAATRAVSAWLSSTATSSAPPPAALLELAAAAVRLEPLDETAAAQQVELLARAGRLADASRAFHRLRAALDECLGMSPSLTLVRRHGDLVADSQQLR